MPKSYSSFAIGLIFSISFSLAFLNYCLAVCYMGIHYKVSVHTGHIRPVYNISFGDVVFLLSSQYVHNNSCNRVLLQSPHDHILPSQSLPKNLDNITSASLAGLLSPVVLSFYTFSISKIKHSLKFFLSDSPVHLFHLLPATVIVCPCCQSVAKL